MVARARAAQPGWEAIGFEGRAQRAAARAEVGHATTGPDRPHDRGGDRQGVRGRASSSRSPTAPMTLGYWARHAARVPGRRARAQREPRASWAAGSSCATARSAWSGVIGPWNYPLVNCFGDGVPALAAGNAVVLKPSRGDAAHLAAAARVPARVRAARGRLPGRHGRGRHGRARWSTHVDMIMFTGSTETGPARLRARRRRRLIPVSLELGGKDPMIVLADADVERAARAAVYYGLQNAGQTCISVERVYVEAPVYDEFVDKVTRKVARAAPGRPGRARQRRRRGDDDARRSSTSSSATWRRRAPAGARVLAGGRARRGAGGFYEPTVLVDVDHDMDVHARGDLRPDAADHEGGRRRGGASGSPTTRPTGSAPPCGRATPPAARRSPRASSRASCASTTRT